jgi:hypothetical protein
MCVRDNWMRTVSFRSRDVFFNRFHQATTQLVGCSPSSTPYSCSHRMWVVLQLLLDSMTSGPDIVMDIGASVAGVVCTWLAGSWASMALPREVDGDEEENRKHEANQGITAFSRHGSRTSSLLELDTLAPPQHHDDETTCGGGGGGGYIDITPGHDGRASDSTSDESACDCILMLTADEAGAAGADGTSSLLRRQSVMSNDSVLLNLSNRRDDFPTSSQTNKQANKQANNIDVVASFSASQLASGSDSAASFTAMLEQADDSAA